MVDEEGRCAARVVVQHVVLVQGVVHRRIIAVGMHLLYVTCGRIMRLHACHKP
jgi:hypothetical protein